jgi:hypothetical protein
MKDDDVLDHVSLRQKAMAREHDYKRTLRNATLEEVAKEFDNMKSLGDTAASFAAYVRNMKK